MAKSKAYLSCVLFAFFLSSVLAHVQETSSENKNQHSYNDEGNVFKHQNPTSSQDMETHWRSGSSMPSFSHFVGHGHKTPRLADVGKSTRAYIVEADELGEPKTMPGTGSSHYTHSATYNPSNSGFTEPKNYLDAYGMRHRYMVRPSQKYWRARRDDVETPSPTDLRARRDVKNYVNASVMRHRNMVRPSEIDWRARRDIVDTPPPAAVDWRARRDIVDTPIAVDWRARRDVVDPPPATDLRAFNAFKAKTFRMKNDGKTGYDGVPKKEDGEEIKF